MLNCLHKMSYISERVSADVNVFTLLAGLLQLDTDSTAYDGSAQRLSFR